jgi:LacI family transcriptional regulator, galactose operon repressor
LSATLADIARATGTSISTVSRVLTGAPAAKRISPETRDRIALAAQQIGYRPNLLARSLRTRRTNTIALMVSDIANPWFGLLASLIEQTLSRSGYSTMVCNSCEDAQLEQQYLRLLPQKGIDGLIIVPLSTHRDELMRPLPEEMPVVVVDRPVEGITASITSDQQKATELLCDGLQRVGVKRAALVRGPEHIFTHRLRAEAIRRRFKVVVDHEGPAQRETGHAAWQKCLGQGVDAVVCTNNFLGLGAIEAMSGGTERPAIGVYDEIPMMNLLPMPIVCCMQDVPRLAEGAVELLMKQMAGAGQVAIEPITVAAHITHNLAFEKALRTPTAQSGHLIEP